MRAFVITGPGVAGVEDVPEPVAGPGEVIVAVERVGVCGTDVEMFDGAMAYLESGLTQYPIRPGHEWSGTVAATGAGVEDAWLGRRVTGDTMLGDGTCDRCRRGHQHLCARVCEVGIRGRDGALAERLAVPVSSLHVLPVGLDAELGALVEPAGTALRAARAAAPGPGDAVLVVGAGTMGLLTAMFLRAAGAAVHLTDVRPAALAFAAGLGFDRVWDGDQAPASPFRAVVDASTDSSVPARAVDVVEPGGRVVYLGVAGHESPLDARRLVLADLTVVGILSASPALADVVEAFAGGVVDPRPLVAGVVPLERTADVLTGWRPADAGPGPKVHIDPRR